MPKLRVGIVDSLNSRPLAWGFLKGHHNDLFVPSYHSAARIAALLAQGELEVALLCPLELQRIDGLAVIPDLCVAAQEEAKTALLVSRVPFDRVRRVALDIWSRTSAALVQVLLAERYQSWPELVEERPDRRQMLAECDAALVVGDRALRLDRHRLEVLDLAAEWRLLTGLPFVFAVWAVRQAVQLRQLVFYFKSSLRFGLASMDQLVRESAAETGLDSDEVLSYLTGSSSYVLGPAERRGLEEFLLRARRHGLVADARPLRFWSKP